jgi:hypothetical protein
MKKTTKKTMKKNKRIKIINNENEKAFGMALAAAVKSLRLGNK